MPMCGTAGNKKGRLRVSSDPCPHTHRSSSRPVCAVTGQALFRRDSMDGVDVLADPTWMAARDAPLEAAVGIGAPGPAGTPRGAGTSHVGQLAAYINSRKNMQESGQLCIRAGRLRRRNAGQGTKLCDTSVSGDRLVVSGDTFLSADSDLRRQSERQREHDWEGARRPAHRRP
jgi:hypothetical protein